MFTHLVITYIICIYLLSTSHFSHYFQSLNNISKSKFSTSSSPSYQLSFSARLISSGVWSSVCRSISTPWNRSIFYVYQLY